MNTRKTLFSLGLALALVAPLLAQEKERVTNSGTVMQEILPSVLKFAIGTGGSHGRGAMTCRGGSTFHGQWGAPTTMALEGGIFGLRLGGNAIDFILFLMSPRSAENILKSKVKLGADASAAGPVGRAASAETDATLRAEILSYSRSRGRFAGVSLQGSTLRPDNDANKNLYGKEVSAQDSVFKKAVPVPDCANVLLETLQKASPVNKSTSSVRLTMSHFLVS